MPLIQPLKFINPVLVAACILMPWNATAINHGSLTDQLIGKSLGHNLVESLLVKSLLEITEGKTKQAFETVNELIRTAPNFKLAYLIRGDLLTARTHALTGFGDSNATETNGTPSASTSSEEINGLRDEARTRIEYYLSQKKTTQLPNLFVKLSAEQENLIVVDTAKSRLYLFKKVDGELQYAADYYVTVGKNGVGKQTQGDKRTPLGVYFAGTKLTQPLDDIYGDAAYPLNYPNELDQHQNKNGSGIWLHGTPSGTYSRPPRASDGCVVLSNPDLKALQPILQTGKTPVIIADNLEWLDAEKSDFQTTEKQDLQKAIEAWRKDWVSQDTDEYLSHYSKKFFYSDGGLSQWGNYKRGIQASKPKVTIQINDISMFGYPGFEQPIVLVNFEQDFKSPSLQNKMRKRQYWVNENDQWKIIYEGAG